MCDVCDKKDEAFYKNTIHIQDYEPILIHLCYQHDLELFKKGQMKFIKSYQKKLAAILMKTTPIKAENT